MTQSIVDNDSISAFLASFAIFTIFVVSSCFSSFFTPLSASLQLPKTVALARIDDT